MTAKIFEDRVEAYKAAQKNIAIFNSESVALTDEIGQLQADIDQLKNQRDALEVIQNDSASLMIAGKMTRDEFSKNKEMLSKLYGQIDDAQDLLEMFQKKLNNDSRRLVDLNNQLTQKSTMLRTAIAQNLAAEIADNAGEQIKQLVALLPSVHGDHVNFNANAMLGFWIAAGVYGGTYDSPKAPPIDEKKQLLKSIYERIGV